MQRAINGHNSREGGIQIHGRTSRCIASTKRKFRDHLKGLGLDPFVKTIDDRSDLKNFLGFQWKEIATDQLTPEGDTSQLCQKLQLDTFNRSGDLEREILVAMLLCPVPFQFPSYDELITAVHIRRNIVEAARKTSLSFATYEAERPAEYWHYDEDRGFVLHPGKSLIAALKQATQPELSGQRYTFSCRRAAEYIMLLAMASEAMTCNPDLFHDLQRQAETRAIKGREFESVFLRPIGSLHNPLPVKFFIPGDRTWFRNPDRISSEVTGYEGSWTFYLGNGQFADFWRPGQFYSLTTKCLSIFHWRNSTYRDAEGELQIDEQRVESLVEKSLQNPAETNQILREMLQLQEPLDVFAGGAIEAHREHARQIFRGSSDLTLPDILAKGSSEGVMN